MPRRKKPHGGHREGAGRPPLDPALRRERVVLYLTAEEEEKVRAFVEELRRQPSNQMLSDADSDNTPGT